MKFNVGFDVWIVLFDKFLYDYFGYFVLVFVYLVFLKLWFMSKEKIIVMLIENKWIVIWF